MSETQPNNLEGELLVGDAKIAIVTARFNEFITKALLDSAVNHWTRLGGSADRLTTAWVPGSFELPVAAKKLAESGEYQAVICLGCVIRGETDHYDHVVEQTAKGIREVGTQTGVPCIFGVITCETLEQAIHRAGAKLGNQGGKAMMAAIEMANLLKKI
ncbi:6,7-dimethyl-8-ribityllumazine synthase [Phycisphaerales bacterium AB-hyl4]|uniref:6,7-dimethyl-8-ribityllumazine synthase n=1 Tax=Natronomicrosphaera hydrolytica TaxID=3242702 RepID=A0ABV4U500_9BACT